MENSTPQPQHHKRMRTYKIYGNITGTANNVANVLIARTGRIRCIRWEAAFDAPADNASCVAELSTAPSTAAGTNDTPNSIDELRSCTNLTTSGAFNGARSKQSVVDYPVAAGERVYLHATVSGSVGQPTTVFLDVDEK